MRNIVSVIDQVLPLLTSVTPADGSNESLTTAVAGVKTIRKQAMYYPPEADGVLWTQLGQTLYRNLPAPTSVPLIEISQIVTGSTIPATSAANK